LLKEMSRDKLKILKLEHEIDTLKKEFEHSLNNYSNSLVLLNKS